jgi:DNA-3-methyladenine glycosylase II
MSTRRSARISAAAAEAKASAEAMPPPPLPAAAAAAPKSRKRKAAAATLAKPTVNGHGQPDPETPQEAPSTPNKRRTKAKTAVPPPATPTPSNAKLIGEAAAGRTSKARDAAAVAPRLADPQRSNAMLLSPETSRVVASKPLADAVSPSKAAAAATTTTANILREACAHLVRVDPRMKPLIDAHHCRIFSPEGLAERVDPFEALCSGIISQQVSGAAAKAIKRRFVNLFYPEEEDVDDDDSSSGRRPFPHPSAVVAMSFERLRTAGLSQRKAEYIQGLAGKFAAGELTADLLREAPYDEVLERLIAVRGLGQWSVEMFACFALKRMDVFSLGDLGVQRGMAAFVGRDVAKLKAKGGKWKYMSEAEMEALAERFRPYRSLFMWYMWRVEETDVSTME